MRLPFPADDFASSSAAVGSSGGRPASPSPLGERPRVKYEPLLALTPYCNTKVCALCVGAAIPTNASQKQQRQQQHQQEQPCA